MLAVSGMVLGKLTRSQDSQPIFAGRACICRRRINPQAQGFADLGLQRDWAIVSDQDRAVERGFRCP